MWRQESAHVLGALLRTHADLADCEDAAQEALLAATEQWPRQGPPQDRRGWLIAVARRRLIDQFRSTSARHDREQREAARDPVVEADRPVPDADGTLQVMLLCCHPGLSRDSQVALTLRCVAGLSTEEIAAAYLVPSATMGQRISRAKTVLREQPPAPVRAADAAERIAAVLDVCHLVFNEGYTRTTGEQLVGVELAEEAIRLTRMLHAAVPDHDEAAGALALMLLTHARSDARADAAGDLIPLADQDRSRWDAGLIAEGVALLERTLPRGHVGRYQLQAAIAAVHAEAATWEQTDWRQIAGLYDLLERVAPSPSVTLGHAVAVGMVHGPQAAISRVRPLLDQPRMQRHHRVHAVLAHLLEESGDLDGAAEHYRTAARLTASLPEQRYLNGRLAALTEA